MEPFRPEHRRQMRNLFALLRAVVRRTSDSHTSVEDYAAMLEARIDALARIHEMMLRAPVEGIDLQEIVCSEVLAHAIPAEKYDVRGPEIRVTSEAAMPLAMAVHELTVNALVHGAFSASGGQASVSWERVTREDAPWLRFTWVEEGLELEVSGAARRRGFGTEILEQTLAYELNSHATTEFARTGARTELLIPSEATFVLWRPGIPAEADSREDRS